MNYYEKHLGDYAKDAGHLSILEHGVYNLLMDRYYGTEQGIADEDKYRKIRAQTEEERAAVDVVLREFFHLDDDGVWRKGRIQEEIAKARKRMETARANGQKGGRRAAGSAEDDGQGTEQEPTGLPAGSDPLTEGQALHTPSTNTSSPDGEEVKRGKRARKSSGVEPLWLTVEQMQDGSPDLSTEVASTYMAYRRNKKAPLTKIAWRDIVKEIRKVGRPIDGALAYAMNRNWQGFDATWVPGFNAGHSGGAPPPAGRAGRQAAALAELDEMIADGLGATPTEGEPPDASGDDFIDVPSRRVD